MKTCSKCGIEKELSEFNMRAKSKDGLAHQCKSCKREYYKKYYKDDPERYKLNADTLLQRMRNYVIEAKNVPCMDCGVSYPSYVMDFDHRDPSQKVANVSQLARRGNWIKIKAEIEKCDVICANCHRERTHGRSKTNQ
jgi:hypothetical protein